MNSNKPANKRGSGKPTPHKKSQEAESNLTAKQKRFVDEYALDQNATQAAIRAGYSQKTAGSVGSENLTKPEIAKAIENRLEKLSEQTENRYEDRVKVAQKILSRAMNAEPVIVGGEAVEGEYTFDARGALAANDQLARLGGYYRDKMKIEGDMKMTHKAAPETAEFLSAFVGKGKGVKRKPK